MSSFTDPLVVQKLPSNFWMVVKGFRYYIGCENSSEFVDIPNGFITDFASTPFGVRNLIPKDGIYSQAAVLHDFMYQKQLYPQKKCDKIFLEAMQVLGVSWWKRHVMYRALRLFGFISYNKNNK